jgi:hypothetical protein
LLWTTKSTRKLSVELTSRELKVGHSAVAKILKAEGYGLLGSVRLWRELGIRTAMSSFAASLNEVDEFSRPTRNTTDR